RPPRRGPVVAPSPAGGPGARWARARDAAEPLDLLLVRHRVPRDGGPGQRPGPARVRGRRDAGAALGRQPSRRALRGARLAPRAAHRGERESGTSRAAPGRVGCRLTPAPSGTTLRADENGVAV